ncbi:hypothetical protein QZM78_11570 [Burkholderia multivorans]|nr:hypothetical protein [Burkholderia multivorans]
MTDPNHDIVPTLRMFDGVMTGLAADEIERLRKRVAELEAGASAETRDLPMMRNAFRVTEVSGDPDPAKQSFAMRFSFPSIEALHAADDEWNKFIAAAQADAREGLTDESVKRAFYAADCKTWYETYPSAAMDVARAILAANLGQPGIACAGGHGIAGLGRMTNDDDGFVRLQFVTEAAAEEFMEAYGPTVDVSQLPEPRAEVANPTSTVGRLLATAPHFEECETSEPSLSALIHRYYENYFGREKGRKYAELYIAALYDAARAGEAS